MKTRFYKRLLIILLCIGLLLPPGLNRNYDHVSAAVTGIVTASTLNVRSEPSISADKLQLNGINVYLRKGETVTIHDEEGDWYFVSLSFNGKAAKGYVSKDYVKTNQEVTVTPTPSPEPTSKPTPKPTPSTTPKPTPKPSDKPVEATDKGDKEKYKLKATVTASSLNVRSGPGTTYSKAGVLYTNSSVTVIDEILKGSTKWYMISFKNGGVTKTGYVSSLYIKLDYKTAVKGEVADKSIKVRQSAGNKAAYLKDNKGKLISLKKGKKVNILSESTISNEKWFKVSFTIDGKKYTGYTLANQTAFQVINSESTSVPTPTPTSTPKPTQKPSVTPTPKPTNTPTPKPTNTPAPTQKPTQGPTVTPTPTPTPTLTPTPTPTPIIIPTTTPIPTPGASFIEVPDIQIYDEINTWRTGYVCNTVYLNVVANILASEAYLVDEKQEPVILNNGHKVTVESAISVDNKIWYKINFQYYWRELSGHVRAEYIYVGDEPPVPVNPPVTANPTPIPIVTVTPTPMPPIDNVDFETKLASQGFPESYKEQLRILHTMYPNWEFTAYHTGLDWNVVINEESKPGKNTIPNWKSPEWLSFEDGAYDWKTDTFILYDGTYWVTTSRAAIEYYMDPRNFLTENGIFQFELLKYQDAYQNLQGVEGILKGTALYNTSYSFTDENGILQTYTYGETIMKAAQYSGVSPYHLASRIKQEVVTGATTLSNSVSGTYKGYEGYYNFYNIGANDSPGGGAIANGLRYAKNGTSSASNNLKYLIPWTNQYRSIVGGGFFLGSSYIHRGQDTVYLQKFNVTPTSTYFHQYMTNVEAPFAESKKIATAYKAMADTKIVFSIPVYLNMPSKPSPLPTTQFNPNNRLKSLKVLNTAGEELTITPTFSQTEMYYYLIVPNNVEMVEIKATAVSKKATVLGTGFITLNQGINEIKLPVIAENGNVAEYIINIVRE